MSMVPEEFKNFLKRLRKNEDTKDVIFLFYILRTAGGNNLKNSTLISNKDLELNLFQIFNNYIKILKMI